MQIICKTTLALVPVLAHTTPLHSIPTRRNRSMVAWIFTLHIHMHTHTNVRGGGGWYLVVGIWKRDRGGVTHNEPDENPLSTAITSKAKHRLTTFAKCGEWGTVERNKQEILNERTATFNCLCSTHTHEDICISYVRSLLSKLKNVGGSNTTN